MPYTGPDDPSLPTHIKELSEAKRKKWISIFEDVMSEDGSESDAMIMANGAMSKELDVWDYEGRKTPIFKRLFPIIRSLFRNKDISIGAGDSTSAAPLLPVETDLSTLNTISFYKDVNGNTRFLAIYSNKYKDRHGEIISEAAHKEYEQWVNVSKSYPPLQLWHCGPGSEIGKTDIIAYEDGFAFASGIIHEKALSIVDNLITSKISLGMSHGFFGLKQLDTYIQYRPFEISILPIDNASNPWTSLDITRSGEFGMPISDAKKTLFKSLGISDDQIANMEVKLDEMQVALKASGVEFKEADAVGNAPSIAQEVVTLTGLVSSLASTVAILTASTKDLTEKYTVRLSDAVAAEIEAKLIPGMAQVVQASKSSTNVIDPNAGGNPQQIQATKDIEFFNAMMRQTINSIQGGGLS